MNPSRYTKLVLAPPGEFRFKLGESIAIDLRKNYKGSHAFFQDNTHWATLEGNVLTILKGYAWDGCSPAIRVFGKWVGTPTPPGAVVPSLVHDVMCQFVDTPCAPYSQKDANDIFYDLMTESGFPLRRTYHGAVAKFGGIYRKVKPSQGGTSCSYHP